MRRSFKEYLKHWEDAAANSVSAGGIAMPADMMPKDKHKKHNDIIHNKDTNNIDLFRRAIASSG